MERETMRAAERPGAVAAAVPLVVWEGGHGENVDANAEGVRPVEPLGLSLESPSLFSEVPEVAESGGEAPSISSRPVRAEDSRDSSHPVARQAAHFAADRRTE